MPKADDSAERRRAAVNKYNAKRREQRLSEGVTIPAEKRCLACGETKPAEAFSKHSVAADGLRPRCKTCIAREHSAGQDEKGRKRRMSASLMDRLGVEMPAPPIEDTPDGPIMRVPLSQGAFAVIDAADWPRISGRLWFYIKDAYAVSNAVIGGKKRIIYMHVVIFGDPNADEVDHRDRDKLNNRRGNLRAATRLQNIANSPGQPVRTSRFKGLRLLASGKWQARLRHDGGEISLGTFADESDAARAYDAAQLEIYGEFAALNFVT